MRRFYSLSLVLVLLFGRAVVLAHDYDFAAHDSEDICVTCLHAKAISNGMVGTAIVFVSIVVVHSDLYSCELCVKTGIIPADRRSRSPPSIFSV